MAKKTDTAPDAAETEAPITGTAQLQDAKPWKKAPRLGTIVQYQSEEGPQPAMVLAVHEDGSLALRVFVTGKADYELLSVSAPVIPDDQALAISVVGFWTP